MKKIHRKLRRRLMRYGFKKKEVDTVEESYANEYIKVSTKGVMVSDLSVWDQMRLLSATSALAKRLNDKGENDWVFSIPTTLTAAKPQKGNKQ